MLRRNMAKYRSIAGISTGIFISVFLTPMALAIPTYNELLKTDYDIGSNENTSIAQMNNTNEELTKYVDSKQENFNNIVNDKVDELTRNFSTVVGILDIILFNDIIRNIQSHQFSIASDQLPYIKNYKYVVSKIYNNQIANFDLLLQFGDSVPDFRCRINVYNALYNEMKANGHKDIGKLLLLSESLEKGISNSSNKDNIAETRLLISTLWNENQEVAIQFISNAFLNNSLWSMVEQLTETINSSCTYCVDRIYSKVTENVLKRPDASDIFKQARTNLECSDECVSYQPAICLFIPSAPAAPNCNRLKNGNDSNLTQDDSSIAELNNTIVNLKKHMDSEQEDLKILINKVDEITRNFSAMVEILDLDITSYNNIVRNIQSHQFSNASEQLLYIQNYKYVVGKVYNKQIANFDLLLQFGNSVSDFRCKINVYKALYNEMRANGHKDIRKLLQLSESLEKVISNSSNKDNIADTQLLISTLWNENHEAAIQPISDAFLNNNSWQIVEQLTKDINSTCTDCIGHVYFKVIGNILNQVNAIDLLKLAKAKLKCLDECVSIHQAVFNKLDKTSTSYSDTIISLARHIKATMDDPNYKKIHPDWQTRHKVIKDKLPLSVKNMVFASYSCIRNTEYKEYFFASSWHAASAGSGITEVQENVPNSIPHSVFTWIGGEIAYDKSKFIWTFSAIDDNKFIIHNKWFHDEYLYLSSNTFNPNGRLPYMKKLTNGTVTDPLGYWSFEVNQDRVYIKNTNMSEFLFAHSQAAERAEAKKERRMALTYIPGGPTSGSIWEIIDCTNT